MIVQLAVRCARTRMRAASATGVGSAAGPCTGVCRGSSAGGHRVVASVSKASPTTSNAMILSVLSKSMLFFGLRVLQHDPLAGLVLREVDDDLVALGHAVPEAGHRSAASGIRPPSVPITVIGVAGVERPLVGAGDRGVEDPEAVLAPLDLHHRPRHAVDQDHVAVDARTRCCRRDSRSPFVAEHRVARRSAARRTRPCGIGSARSQRRREVVLAGQAHVGVLARCGGRRGRGTRASGRPGSSGSGSPCTGPGR